MLFIACVVFVLTVVVVLTLVYATGPQTVDIGRRLSRSLKTPTLAAEENAPVSAGERAQNVFVTVGKVLPPPKGKALLRDQKLLVRAGFRSENALYALMGAKVLFTGALIFLTTWTGLASLNIAFPLLAAGLGWFGPDLWVSRKIKLRQKKLRQALPDAMDLLVICVEVGLGLDQAMMRVAEELELSHPELSDEFQIVNLEMRMGKTRMDALRELADRTGLDDIKALVGILVQTDRFGTSIVQALRTYSDELRTKRRQRAEEAAAKVSVKMVPVLVFFIFPALLAVIIGPAVLQIMRNLLPAMK